MAMEEPLSDDKGETARAIRDECIANHPIETLISLPPNLDISCVLHSLLNMNEDFITPKKIDWIRWLVAGGLTPQQFCTEMKVYDNATTCGNVWTADVVAYRCKTCSISPCMSLCCDCFKMGNHEDHDYNMFKSQAGGACDCGNSSVMHEPGFCTRHGANVQSLEPTVQLIASADVILPRLFHRFIIMCRQLCKFNNNINMNDVVKSFANADPFFAYLEELLEMGSAMRTIIRKIMLSKKFYHESLNPPVGYHYYEQLIEYRNNYCFHLKDMPTVKPPPGFEDVKKYMDHELAHEYFLDEIVFWMVKYQFPQKLVCFLLNMRPDAIYEKVLAKSFVEHYSRVAKSISFCPLSDPLCSSIVHVSVQLFSDQERAFKMASEYSLLYILILSIRDTLRSVLVKSDLYITNNKHTTVDCASLVMKDHNYWPMVSDLNNILSSKQIATLYICDERLFNVWYETLTMFQGMNVNFREITTHLAFEPQTYYAAFSAESEACASLMWTIAAHMVDPVFRPQAIMMTKSCLNHILLWLKQSEFPENMLEYLVQQTENRLSFHIPLHRYFVIHLWGAVKYHNVHREDLLPDNDALAQLILHPLKVVAGYYEILSGLWVKNGLQITGQVITYTQCHFANSMIDADLFLLQLGAMSLDAETLITNFSKMFDVTEFFFMTQPEATWVQYRSSVESFLIFLTTLVTTRTFIDADDHNTARREMAALLSMYDKTHSYLIGGMPEKSSSNMYSKEFEEVLTDLSDFQDPNVECSSGNIQQGIYLPKAKVWDEYYDPIHVLLRAVQRKDYQNSFERFKNYCRKSGKVTTDKLNLWPPYKMPSAIMPGFEDPRKVLSCGKFQAMLLIFLQKVYNERELCETLLPLIIYLFEMIVDYQAGNRVQNEYSVDVFHENDRSSKVPVDGCPEQLFKTDDIFVNATMNIHRIKKDYCNVKYPLNECASIDGSIISAMDTTMDHPMTQAIEETITLSIAAGSELVPYQDEASALALPEDQDFLVPYMPNVEHPEIDREFMAIDNEPTAGAIEFGNASILPAPRYPALLSGSEVGRLPEISAENFSSDLVPLPEDDHEMEVPHRIRRYAGHRARAISTDDTLLVETFATCSEICLSLLEKNNDYIEMNCSIISVLLQLHARLSGRPGSYKPDFESTEDSRIGNGAFFVAKLLNKLGRHSSVTAEYIVMMQKRLFPQFVVNYDDDGEQSAESADDKKKSHASERRKRVLAQFAEQQRQFMERNNCNFETMDMGSETSEENVTPEYHCVICSQTTVSTCEEPVGLIALSQSTSLLSHKSNLPFSPKLPNVYKDLELKDFTLLGKYMYDKTALIEECFGANAAIMAVNNGWEGGLHVQTCGHYIHLDCHQSYMQTLQTQPRSNTVSGEFLCPLCRHLSNSIIPVGANIAELSSESHVTFSNEEDKDYVIFRQLTKVVNPPFTDLVYIATTNLMETFTKTTFPRYRTKTVDPACSTLMAFVCSIVRTNLEIELVQRGCNLVNQRETPGRRMRSAHLMPLMYNLGYHSKVLTTMYEGEVVNSGASKMWYRQLWASVTQKIPVGFENEEKLDTAKENGVPLLFRDPVTVLLQIILMLPLKLELSLMNCVMNNIYQVAIIRAIADQLCQLTEKQRLQLLDNGPLAPLFSMVHLYLKDSAFFRYEVNHVWDTWSPQQSTNEVRESCLQFLRIAALLKVFTRNQKVPFIVEHVLEIDALEQFLGVFDTCSVVNPIAIDEMCGTLHCKSRASGGPPGFSFDSLSPVETRVGKLSALCRIWCSEISSFAATSPVNAVNLLVSKRFFSCHLIRLPNTYDELFQLFYNQPCSQCGKFSINPALCLVCGTLLCLRDNTSTVDELSEARKHSLECGAGTGIYLSIMQSYVYIIRGMRFACWGSLHLDVHGEEDKDLKRGKPLYLNKKRFDLLEELWISLRFDSIDRRWLLNRDIL